LAAIFLNETGKLTNKITELLKRFNI